MSTHEEALKDIKKAKEVLDSHPVVQSKKFLTHTSVSMVKSAVRILAGGFLITGNLLMAGVCLIAAEFLGVAEELV